MRKINIQGIFSMFLILANTLVFSGYMVYYYQTTKAEMTNEPKATAIFMADRLSGGLRMPLWSMDKKTTEDMISSNMSRHAWGVIVSDEYDNVFFGMTRDADWQIIHAEDAEFDGDVVTAEQDILDRDSKLGKVSVHLTPRFMEEQLSHAISSMIFALLILNIIIFLLLYVFVRKVIIQPIMETVSCLCRLSVGELPEIITIRCVGEFNKIKESLNILIETMSETVNIGNEVAAGNISIVVTERSENDLLMRAMNRMTNRLSNVIQETKGMIQSVGEGRLDVRGNAQAFEGGWHDLVSGVNHLISKLGHAISHAAAVSMEMELAKKIQTVLLPKRPEIRGYEIAATMEPSEAVGGDYYDVISVSGYDWVVIGDVSGHGVTAGLVMMMVQTAIHTVLNENPETEPSRMLSVINKTIYNNIERMDESKHMTIVVLASGKNGYFTFSGLHEDILIRRAHTGKVESVKSDGMWIGLEPDISEFLSDDTLQMELGDCMVLFTDGITEAHCEGGKLFGDDRLIGIIEENGDQSAAKIRESIIDALESCETPDDVTLVVMKRV